MVKLISSSFPFYLLHSDLALLEDKETGKPKMASYFFLGFEMKARHQFPHNYDYIFWFYKNSPFVWFSIFYAALLFCLFQIRSFS